MLKAKTVFDMTYISKQRIVERKIIECCQDGSLKVQVIGASNDQKILGSKDFEFDLDAAIRMAEKKER